jgi:hypothetical protein
MKRENNFQNDHKNTKNDFTFLHEFYDLNNCNTKNFAYLQDISIVVQPDNIIINSFIVKLYLSMVLLLHSITK